MEVKSLYIYPMKSTQGVLVEVIDVQRIGFQNDRRVAVIDKKGKIVTGRECPELVQLSTTINKSEILITSRVYDEISLAIPENEEPLKVKLFRNEVEGVLFDNVAAKWISNFLQGDYRLIYLGGFYNPVLEKRGGRAGEFKTYSDAAPVHLINLKTLNLLNSKLDTNVSASNFRPNIVIDGIEPFEEDSWSEVKINGCRFRQQERTNRCIFTTIDPKTTRKNKNMQPLKQLTKLRSKMGMRPTFGIGLVPLGIGTIKKGDNVEVVTK